jgi:uncharacterized membrane protein
MVELSPAHAVGGFLVWALIAGFILVVWIGSAAILLRVLGIGRSRDDSGKLLRERFARGEITAAEYEEARRILGF